MQHQTRRSFLQLSAGAALAAPLFGLSGSVRARPSSFDPSFGTATEAMAALRARRISSRELTGHVFARIARHNPSLNVFVTLLEEQALRQAAIADEERVRGAARGALHGLPVLMKDVFMTAGVRTTCGSPQYQNFVPTEDATVVARMKRAGAILIGKTNMPENASDWQSFNAIAGQTNNPWDLSRTPGGSTGGGAAALAAGMGFLETGSDFGGSIRTPANFCGVYGHKPSLDLVPWAGHIPPPPPPNHLWTNPILVAGPLARSAEDLVLGMSVLAGPDLAGISWNMPRPRKSKLRDYRIGYVLDDPYSPVDEPVKKVLAEAIAALRAEGVTLVEGWPADVSLGATFELYFYNAGAVQGNAIPAAERARLTELVRSGGTTDPYALGVAASHYDYTMKDVQRLRQRAAWQLYFQSFDAFLSPAHFIPAFPHDPSLPRNQRTLLTSTGPRPYFHNMHWISPASITGLPATAAPIGFTDDGLPVGVQIIGPYYEDGTPIDVAKKLADVLGGFTPPPDYVD